MSGVRRPALLSQLHDSLDRGSGQFLNLPASHVRFLNYKIRQRANIYRGCSLCRALFQALHKHYPMSFSKILKGASLSQHLMLLINARSWGGNPGSSDAEPSVFPTSTQVTSRSHFRSTNKKTNLFLKHQSPHYFSILLRQVSHSTAKSNCSRHPPVENTLSLPSTN